MAADALLHRPGGHADCGKLRGLFHAAHLPLGPDSEGFDHVIRPDGREREISRNLAGEREHAVDLIEGEAGEDLRRELDLAPDYPFELRPDEVF